MHLPRRERALRSLLGFGMLRSGEEPNNLPQFIQSFGVGWQLGGPTARDCNSNGRMGTDFECVVLVLGKAIETLQ